MYVVNLNDSTFTSRELTRAVVNARTDLGNRRGTAFLADGPYELLVSPDTWERVITESEFRGYRGATEVMGMRVVLDPTVRYGTLWVVDARTRAGELIEVR